MTDRELMQQALEALELLAKYENPQTKIQVRKPRDGGPIVTVYPHKVATDAAAPLRERLADITHTCSYHCERPECVRAQRDELRERLATPQVTPQVTPQQREWVWQEPVAWTPVSVAMPKSGVTVLACYKNSHDKVRRIRAHWTAAKTEEASAECEWGEYDEDADTYWTPEGWYECIDNWDDYTSVFVHEGEITHWMPMPTDPYTAPQREWVGLTEEEIRALPQWFPSHETAAVMPLIRAIEAKLREKNA